MRPRVFFALASLATGLVAVAGLGVHVWHPDPGDLAPLTISGLMSVMFGAVAYIEGPGPRQGRVCRACGGTTLTGMGFCTACGAARTER